MGTFLLLLLIFFVVIPLCRVMWRVWQVSRTMHRAQRDLNDLFGQAARGTRASAQGGSARTSQGRPATHRKKIDPDAGEYVAFEEVSVKTTTTTTDTARGRDFCAESQIEDAEWEEVK